MEEHEYECVRCDYKASRKHHMQNHINKKVLCKSVKSDKIPKEHEDEILYKDYDTRIICICDKTFKTRNEFIQHNGKCRQKYKKMFKDIENENESLKKQIKELESRIVTIKQGGTNNLNNSGTINIDIGTLNVKVELTSYKNPNIENMDKIFSESIRKAILSIPNIVKNVHFNENIPENHNIKISNYKNDIGNVFTGKMWETINEKELLRELIYRYYGEMEDWVNYNEDYRKYLDNINRIIDRDGEENVNKAIEKELKKIIYDNTKRLKI